MESESYPQFTIFLVLLLGIGLALLRPYAAFLFSVLLLTAGHVDRFNQTRLPGLGPYFNLGDACLFVALVAFFLDTIGHRKAVRIPQIVMAMFFVLVFSAVQSLWKLGGTYETLRACRWAIQFPVCFLLGANMVDSADRGRKLVMALLAGAVLAALQHLLFAASLWQTKSLNLASYERMRTIGFWAGCMPSAFLVTGVLAVRPRGMLQTVFYVAVGLLFAASLFLNQTRSLWMATACAVPGLAFLFMRRRAIAALLRVGVIGVLTVFTLAWVCERIMPGLSVLSIATDRIERLFDQDQANVHMGTRERAFNAEMASWADGTLLFGRGLCFFQTVKRSDDYSKIIAYNHLGYVTYLSQMGLIGLLVYGFYVPFGVLQNARSLWSGSDEASLRSVALLGGASIICLSLMFVASSHFLGLGYEAPAVLYGSLWVLARASRADSVGMLAEEEREEGQTGEMHRE